MKIEINNLNVFLGNTRIIKDISMKIMPKQIVSIIGPNGSGKSTLLKTIYRYLKTYTGEILINGIDIKNIPSKELAQQMAVVAQFNQKGFEFTVEQIVSLGRTVHQKLMEKNKKEDYEIIDEAIRENALEDKRHTLISNLSGGERQRVSVARAMAQGGQCMILDEPSNHLDVKHQIQLMRSVTNMDKTIIMAMHDIELAAMYSDYIFVLKEGHLIKEGKPEDIITKDMIKSVYGVKANIIHDELTKHLGISYYK